MSNECKSIFVSTPEQVDPDKNVIATYYVEAKNISLIEAGTEIAAEESIGTWTEVATTTKWIVDNLPAKVFQWKRRGKRTGLVKIAYPIMLFDYETGGIPNILSIVAGNLFGLSSLKNVRLLELQLPEEIVKSFKGPKFGIEKLRRIVGTLETRRPHLGTIIKPKVGLNPEQTAEVAYEAAVGGVQFIKDDETLVNQKFCPLRERVTKVMEALDKAKEETGRTVLYAVNVTATINRILEFAETAIDHGANMLMIDVITAGFPALQILAEDPSINVPLHVHRTMHAAMTRNPKHGVHMIVIAKLVRLAGGDQLHTGAVGKMESVVKEVQRINDFLRSEWYGINTVFPVASGGVHPGLVPMNIKLLGEDLVLNSGGGCHGHPLGTRAGAKALSQAIDAYMQGLPLEEYAKTHRELKVALEKWGERFLREE
jgi:ribulose-bisphosphate carboxylase large chain